ncbi:P-loop containing nucleoside triphosphate hydrolase protein [Trametes polyzona]|nr:P-loop containing nucleoside triphosphate hydrolase protein [Trametes polyzona]
MAEPIKCVVVGDDGVGKTSLVIAYTTGNVTPSDDLPAAAEKCTVTVTVREKSYDLKLFDTIGREEHDRFRPMFYPETDIALICFSVASPASFDHVRNKWVPEVQEHCRPGVRLVVVATQVDLRDDPKVLASLARQDQSPVNRDQGLLLAIDLDAFYAECSAWTGEGVRKVCDEAVQSMQPGRRFVNRSGGCVIL